MKRILFAAGGTMGHIGPAIAVAEEVKRIAPDSIITFVGSTSEVERALRIDFPRYKIIKVPLPRRLGPTLFLFPFKLALALLQSLPLVRRSDVVVGFGGYVATPIYLAARILGRPITLHEANALPGFANRLGKALGATCFANFESVGKAWSCEVIGMPLRQEIIDLANEAHSLRRETRKVLVMGGSQGSMHINEVIWKSLPDLDPSLEIVHAVGNKNLGQLENVSMRRGYQPVGFIEDVAGAYREAALVIARAGAVTCAELRALRKRAILVPLGHGNGEQVVNAKALVDEGMVISVEDSKFTSEWLIAHIEEAFTLRPDDDAVQHLEATKIMALRILLREDAPR
ncbi:MAG: UDP-N-acetylglucosamine--N-acetylmuramyl-(pentapeptide) pyrophosphoryl-undecaprenol N-acetylglucosamine transferase [Candidatus Nanopelagicaceae bacterium]